jgi:hypothetical protein
LVRRNRDLDKENDELMDAMSAHHAETVRLSKQLVMLKASRPQSSDALRRINAENAEITRRNEVAAAYQNLRLQAAEAHLAGRTVDPELAAVAAESKNIHLQ